MGICIKHNTKTIAKVPITVITLIAMLGVRIFFMVDVFIWWIKDNANIGIFKPSSNLKLYGPFKLGTHAVHQV